MTTLDSSISIVHCARTADIQASASTKHLPHRHRIHARRLTRMSLPTREMMGMRRKDVESNDCGVDAAAPRSMTSGACSSMTDWKKHSMRRWELRTARHDVRCGQSCHSPHVILFGVTESLASCATAQHTHRESATCRCAPTPGCAVRRNVARALPY